MLKHILKKMAIGITLFLVLITILQLLLTIVWNENPNNDFENYFNNIFSGNGFGAWDSEQLKELNYSSSSVSGSFFEAFKFSIIWFVPTFIISLILGVTFAVISVFNSYRKRAEVFRYFWYLILTSGFVFFTIILFKIITHWSSGMEEYNSFKDPSQYGTAAMIKSLIFPIMSLIYSFSILIGVIIRKKFIKHFNSPYCNFWRINGFGMFRILFKILIKNSLSDLLQWIIPFSFSILFLGMAVEWQYDIPGLSNYIRYAIHFKDAKSMLFVFLFFLSIYLFNYVFMDLIIILFIPDAKKNLLSENTLKIKMYLPFKPEFLVGKSISDFEDEPFTTEYRAPGVEIQNNSKISMDDDSASIQKPNKSYEILELDDVAYDAMSERQQLKINKKLKKEEERIANEKNKATKKIERMNLDEMDIKLNNTLDIELEDFSFGNFSSSFEQKKNVQKQENKITKQKPKKQKPKKQKPLKSYSDDDNLEDTQEIDELSILEGLANQSSNSDESMQKKGGEEDGE